MKSFLVWCKFIGKLKCRQVSFWLLLAMFLTLSVLLSDQEQKPRQGVNVCVYLEPAKGDEGKLQERFRELLTAEEEKSTLFHFSFVEESGIVIKNVRKGEAECGFVIPNDMLARMLEQDEGRCITVYNSPHSSISPIIQEKLYAALFQVYSGEIFARYAEEHPELGVSRDEAWAAYEKRLGDGSTFGFAYDYETVQDVGTGAAGGEGGVQKERMPVRINPSFRELLGLFLYLLLLLGVYDKKKNAQKRNYYFSGRAMARFLAGSVEMLLPVALVIPVVAFTEAAGFSLLLYVVELWIYGLFMDALLPKCSYVVAAVPVLFIGALVFCPIFMDIAKYVPALDVLQKCFPVTWFVKG